MAGADLHARLKTFAEETAFDAFAGRPKLSYEYATELLALAREALGLPRGGFGLTPLFPGEAGQYWAGVCEPITDPSGVDDKIVLRIIEDFFAAHEEELTRLARDARFAAQQLAAEAREQGPAWQERRKDALRQPSLKEISKHVHGHRNNP